MGTRGITEVIFENDIVVSQYGQWDHYPSGQGITVFNFLKNAANVEKLTKNLGLIERPSTEELDRIYSNYANENGMMTLDDGDRFDNDYPSLTRDTGAGILEVIANATGPVPLYLDLDFKNDQLFCEGVYTVDLTNKTFTTNYNDVTTTITFEELGGMTHDEYLERAHCPVHEYNTQQALAS